VNGIASSAQVHSTLRTLIEVALPMMVNMISP